MTVTESQLLEAINGGFFILATCTFVIFTKYLWDRRSLGYVELQPAIALATVFMGEMLLRGMFWYVRNSLNDGIPLVAPPLLVIIGSLIVMVGVLCCIRVFSPRHWGNRGWVASLILTIGFISWSYLN